MKNWWPWVLAAIVLGIGYWLAFAQPTELQRQVTEGEVYVFWIKPTPTDFEAIPMRRTLALGLDNETALKLTLEQLVAGPWPEEINAGFTTAIPKGVVVNSVVIEGDTATVDFNENIDKNVAGSATVLAIRDQLEKTIKRFPGIHNVVLTVDGEREVSLEP